MAGIDSRYLFRDGERISGDPGCVTRRIRILRLNSRGQGMSRAQDPEFALRISLANSGFEYGSLPNRLLLDLLPFEYLVHLQAQVLQSKGLQKQEIYPSLDRPGSISRLRVRTHQDGSGARVLCVHLFEHIQPRASGHPQIRDHQIVGGICEAGESLWHALHILHFVPHAPQETREGSAHTGLIIHN